MKNENAPASPSVHELADQYLLWGLSVVPVKHGTKIPSLNWKPFQTHVATQAQIDNWFCNKEIGLGVVCGDVSGGLVCLDFDVPDAYDAFVQQNPIVTNFPTAASNRGKHVFFRCPTPVASTELYVQGIEDKAGDIIANRKFVVLPPTVHPEGGTRKWLVPLTKQIPSIGMDELVFGTPSPQPPAATNDVYTKTSFPEGSRHQTLMRMAGEFACLNLSMPAISEVIHQTNRLRCQPPLPSEEVEGILRYVAENRGNLLPHYKEGKDDDLSSLNNIIIPPFTKSEEEKQELYGTMFVRATDYMANFNKSQPVEWLIDDMIPLSYLTVLGATSKAGKSCLITNLSHAVCSGGEFLGLQSTKGSVLWLAYEESEAERRMILSLYESVPENLYITHEKIKLDNPSGIAALQYWIRRTKASLVVIDPLYSAVQADSLSDGRKARVALEGLKDLCRTENVAALVLHHFTKNVDAGVTRERFADSNLILATASMDLLMEWRGLTDGSREIRLSGTGRGDFANQHWVINSPSPSEFLLLARGSKEECGREHIDQEILSVVQSSPSGMTAEEIAKQVGGAVRSVQNRLTFMLKENRVTVIGKRGKANVYGCDRELLAG